ncbi:MAG: TVP38/TMEM64 family protein [Clostridiales bacterium]|jgi:uncharacterized membrane protein YdjX (TVP38/TMEM64 family)|nr:TVP38/TMEM64 family protein [Clostridiales bacterium]
MEDNNVTVTRKQRVTGIILCILIFAVVGVISYFICRPMLEMSKDPAAFRAYIDQQGIKGYAMLMAAMFLQVVAAIIPGGPFEIAAGYAFGVWKGALIADVAMTMGSLFVFLMVRKFGVRFACLFVSKEKLDSVKFFHNSARRDLLAFIFFLIPGTPKDIFTYVMGFTDMKIPMWIFITFVGRFPAIWLSAMSGDAIGEKNYTAFIIMIAIIVVVCIAGSIFYTLWKKKHDEKEAAAAEESAAGADSEDIS